MHSPPLVQISLEVDRSGDCTQYPSRLETALSSTALIHLEWARAVLHFRQALPLVTPALRSHQKDDARGPSSGKQRPPMSPPSQSATIPTWPSRQRQLRLAL